MTTDTAGVATQDVIDLLLDQHEVVKALMTRVAADRGADRDTAFAALADLLERHEQGEQTVVHPAVKQLEAREIAEERMTEEQAADKDLAELRKLGVDSPEFDAPAVAARSRRGTAQPLGPAEAPNVRQAKAEGAIAAPSECCGTGTRPFRHPGRTGTVSVRPGGDALSRALVLLAAHPAGGAASPLCSGRAMKRFAAAVVRGDRQSGARPLVGLTAVGVERGLVGGECRN